MGTARPGRRTKLLVTARTGRTAEIPRPRYFRKQLAWRTWLVKHHASRTERWVGFHKVGTGKPSITWPQSVDEALCFGWIDGLRRGLDEASYAIRFTPRKPTSIWSRVNLRRFDELEKLGLVRAAGRAAWGRRSAARSGLYSHEQARAGLDSGAERALRADAKAWSWFSAQPPSYQRAAGHWVMSAKRVETRERRLATLVACSRKGVLVPPMVWTRPRTGTSARTRSRR